MLRRQLINLATGVIGVLLVWRVTGAWDWLAWALVAGTVLGAVIIFFVYRETPTPG